MAASRVCHVITGLDAGGAEIMLLKLLGAMDRKRYLPMVVSLTDEGVLGDKIRALGVDVRALGMKRGIPNPTAPFKLAGMIRREGVQLVQCWMYHADLLGGLAGWWAGVPVLWGIRQSNFDPRTSKRATIRLMKLCARLSRRLPARIVSCSQTACRVHEEQGYARDKMVVIPNGFQTDLLHPDEGTRERVRETLGIPQHAAVVGIAGRFDPQKDHRTFINAAAALAGRVEGIYFLLCGNGLSRDNAELMGWIDGAGIADRCLLLGRRDDLGELYCAMDAMVSSSAYGEGFPNVVAEAMSCGVPCVVTDVGDSAVIVGDTGRVVPPRDPAALAASVHELLGMAMEERRAMGAAARRRIEEHYSLSSVVNQYEHLYREVLARCAE